MRRVVAALRPGERIEVQHTLIVGMRQWTATTMGAVVHTLRRRHGLHHQRNVDDRVWSDVIVMQRDDGERTTVTVDEFTRVQKIGAVEASSEQASA